MYDSLKDTIDHINNVRIKLNKVVQDLLERMVNHDKTKTEHPEKEGFDEFTPLLATTEYGSEKYWATLEAMKPITDHHYLYNSHHPQYYREGINGMNLLDLIEMLADWRCANERHKDNHVSMLKSIEINSERFGIDEQLKQILLNTASYMEWM